MDTSWSALIVDDDPGIRQSVRLCLEADNARALGVGTPAGALEALDRGRFDVVFLDLWLGREDGIWSSFARCSAGSRVSASS